MHTNILLLYFFIWLSGAATALRLKDESHYEVKRDVLEEKYPAFKTFRGTMHSGMMPAIIIDDDENMDEDEYSTYFFWLLRPKDEDTDESVNSFRNDTLVIWLNGGPGVSFNV